MDLRTAFLSNDSQTIMQLAVRECQPIIDRIGSIEYLVKGLGHIIKQNRNVAEKLAGYIDDTKSMIDIFTDFRHHNPAFLRDDEWQSLENIILARPFLVHFALDKEGNESDHAFQEHNPLLRDFLPYEIDIFINARAIEKDLNNFYSVNAFLSARVLCYIELLHACKKETVPLITGHAKALSHFARQTLNDGLDMIEYIRDNDRMPSCAEEATVRNLIYHLLKLPDHDTSVTFIADWRAKPPAA